MVLGDTPRITQIMASPIKSSERLDIIAEFITPGKTRAGFSVSLNKSNQYVVRRVRNRRKLIEDKIAKLQRELDTLTDPENGPECKHNDVISPE